MDELYIVARRVLLDALTALGPHRNAIVLVGAQAIYLRVGEGDVAVAPYTTDGDLAFDPALLATTPRIEDLLAQGQFAPKPGAIGVWTTHRSTTSNADVEVSVDLLVPETVSPGKGRRAAHLPGHNQNAARIVRGLEGAVVDVDTLVLTALEPADTRAIDVRVAGPAALLVAKLHKIEDRQGTERVKDKDALDVLRLLRGIETVELARRLTLLGRDARSTKASSHGLELLGRLFATRTSVGAEMAVRAVGGLADAAETALSCELLANDLLAATKKLAP